MSKNIHFIDSTLKVIASENLDISQDLEAPDPEKTIAELIKQDEEKTETENTSSK